MRNKKHFFQGNGGIIGLELSNGEKYWLYEE